MKNFKYPLFCAFMFVVFSHLVFADNSFVFTTDPQSVAPNTLSLVITVQSQDASGKGVAVGDGAGDTADVVFTSTSPTGQFLNSTGGAVTKTMSYNSYTKNFYYMDATPGVYTLTVTATTRTSQKVFTASQQIYIGQPVPSGGDSGGGAGGTTGDTTASTTDQNANSGGSSNNTGGYVWSANSSPAPLPDTEAPVDFEISAGRDRLTSVGNDLLFTVTPIETQGVLLNAIGYIWSFGDGSVGEGDSVHHTYKFAGEYSVVVNATASDQMAVDRLTVKVIDPQIALEKVDGGTQVANNSGAEINLEGWMLVSPNKTFTFPKDTLIPAGQKVIFADDTTGINASALQLQNPLGKAYASVSGQNFVMTTDVATSSVQTKSLDDISVSVSETEQKLAMLQSEINSQISVGVTTPLPLPVKPAPSVAISTPTLSTPTLATNDISSTTNNTNQTATVFVAQSSPGIIGRIFSWPIQGFNFIRNLFIEK